MFACQSITYDSRLAESPLLPLTADPIDPLTATTTAPIDTQPPDSFYVRVTRFDPHTVPLNTPSFKHHLHHGSLHGAATHVRREFTIEGEIISNSKAAQQCGLDALNQIWHTEPCPSFTDRGFYRLTWDAHKPGGTRQPRFVFAQMSEFLTRPTEDLEQCCITPFEVKLIAEDARIYTGELNEMTNIKEGFVGGLDIGEGGLSYSTDPLSDLWWPEEITYAGTTKSPLRVTLSIDPNWVDLRTLPPHPPGAYSPVPPAVDPCIWNGVTGQGFCVPWTMQMGDVLVVDGLAGEVTLNGAQLNVATVGAFPSLVPGQNLIVIADETPFQLHGRALCATLEWYDIIV